MCTMSYGYDVVERMPKGVLLSFFTMSLSQLQQLYIQLIFAMVIKC